MATAILGRKFAQQFSLTYRHKLHLHLANLTLAYFYNNDNTIFFQFFIPHSFCPKAILQSKYFYYFFY